MLTFPRGNYTVVVGGCTSSWGQTRVTHMNSSRVHDRDEDSDLKLHRAPFVLKDGPWGKLNPFD